MKKFALIALSLLTVSSLAHARPYILSGTSIVHTSFATAVTDNGQTYFSVNDYYKVAYEQIDNEVAHYMAENVVSPDLGQLIEIERELAANELGEDSASQMSIDQLVAKVMARSAQAKQAE